MCAVDVFCPGTFAAETPGGTNFIPLKEHSIHARCVKKCQDLDGPENVLAGHVGIVP